MSHSPVRPTVIPYITAREGEEGELESKFGVLPNMKGLRYLDETPEDRDERGVLWARCSQSLLDGDPTGKPRWSEVHPLRQRETMSRLRCQVCRGPASRTKKGFLFLASPLPNGSSEPSWPEGLLTVQPPVCLNHAGLSVRECAHLGRAGHVAVRVRQPRPYGVFGSYYALTPGKGLIALPHDDEGRALRYGDPLAGWYLASQLVCKLRGVSIVDLQAELADADRHAARLGGGP